MKDYDDILEFHTCFPELTFPCPTCGESLYFHDKSNPEVCLNEDCSNFFVEI